VGELREAIRASLERHIAESGYSQKEVAEKLGVSKSSVTNWIKGKNSPDVELVLPICKLLNISVREFYGEPDIEEPKITKKAPSDLSEEAQKIAKSYEKLTEHGKGAVKAILGYEEKALSHYSKHEDDGDKIITMPKPKRSGPMVEINVYDQPSAAGLGNYLDEPESHIEQYPRDVIPENMDFGIVISGDSMEPKIHNGGTVFVEARLSIEPGKIGIFVLNGQAYCKKLMVDRENQQIRLVSLNPKYDDIIVSEFDELRTVGRVLGQWTPGYRQELFGW